MSWKWEDFTAPEFDRAVEEAGGVCVVPIGVIEKHGDHLPLGMDVFAARAVAERAAEKEPAIIFPFYLFGQIHCAKHCPGTIAVKMRIALELLEDVCDEIARNGLRKIILMNGHGGNIAMLGHFVRTIIEVERDYVVHVLDLSGYHHPAVESPEYKAMQESEFDYHAGEGETSIMLAVDSELVRMDAVADPESGKPKGRLKHNPVTGKAINWYADFPNHYAGDAATATKEKGELLMGKCVDSVAAVIKAVREDDVTKELQDEFFARIRH